MTIKLPSSPGSLVGADGGPGSGRVFRGPDAGTVAVVWRGAAITGALN